jgi:hypothetical protein
MSTSIARKLPPASQDPAARTKAVVRESRLAPFRIATGAAASENISRSTRQLAKRNRGGKKVLASLCCNWI